jgi:hypothetical protein
MEEIAVAFNKTLIPPLPDGHPLQAQVAETARTMEDALRMLADLKQLLKTPSK